MVDCHVHSQFSEDSKISFEAGILSAHKTGLSGLIFTDHYEYDSASALYTFQFDPQERLQVLNQLQRKYQNMVMVLGGVEIGVQPHVLPRFSALLSSYHFDFVIASVHAIDRKDIGEDAYFERKTKHDVVCRYLQEILYCIHNFDNYDVIGHIGYVCRYMPFEDKSLVYQDHRDLIDEIFKEVIAHGHGIEVNTSGFRQDLGCPIPNFDIINRYRELGGEIITIGSDSHRVEHIGHNFLYVKERLREIGFLYATYFCQRKPVFYKL